MQRLLFPDTLIVPSITACKGGKPDVMSSRAVACILSGVTLLAMFGCVIVPVRLPTQTRDISGGSQRLDFTFLKAGSTSRGEVTKNLGAIDTHADQADFFWGRWESSVWGYGGIVALPPIAGGGGGKRVWGSHNVLIRFDQNGIVTNWVVVDDKKLFPQLDLLDSATVSLPLDLSSPARRNVLLPGGVNDNQKSNPSAELVLSAELLECNQLKILRAKIAKMAPAPEDTPGADARYVWLTIHFLPKHRFQDSFILGVDPPTLLLLRRYIKQTKSASRPKGNDTNETTLGSFK